jgi:hypothetical protein
MQFLKFWGEAIWESLSVGWLVFGIVSTALPALFTLIVRYWPNAAKVNWIKWTADHQSELHVAIALIVIAIYLIYSPYKLYNREHTARIVAEQNKPAQAPLPIKLDVADEESRKQIIDLRRELAEAQETIKKQNVDRDPLSSPIGSAKFTLLVNFKDKKEPKSNYFGTGAAVALGVDGKTVIAGGTADHFSDGDGHSRVVFESPFDSPYMGKPVRSLSEAKYLQIQFADGFVPVDTELGAGRVVLLINSQVTLTFDVPAQKVTTKIPEGTMIVLTDVQQGLAPLTPDTGASPH